MEQTNWACLTVPGRFHYPSPGAAYCHLAPRLRPYIRCVHQGMGVISDNHIQITLIHEEPLFFVK